jgi:non-ribosomal peptide synthetase component F
VVTGLVANARLEEPGGDEVIGVFLNTLPLRMDLADVTPAELARRVFEYEQRAAPYRRYPFAQIQRDLGQPAPPDSYVNVMDFFRGRYSGQDTGLDAGAGVADTNYPLAVDFLVEPERGELTAWLDCDLTVLSERQCAQLAGYYRRALEAVAADGDRLVAEIDLLADAEHAELAAWTATELGYETRQTVPGLIERQARSMPGATALTHQWDQCSYVELDVRANQLAHRLIEVGVRPGDRVGVHVRRGIELVVALLGVLKAGTAYVPMDPAFPAARLAMIAADAEIACLVTDPDGGDGLAAPAMVEVTDTAGRPATPVGVKVSEADVAYVMYTSGSTGTPKGVAVTHANVVNFCAGMDQRVGCGPQDVMLAVTSVSFDISVLELLWPLTRGAKRASCPSRYRYATRRA